MADIRVYAKPQYLYRYRPLGEHIDRELEAIRSNYIFCATLDQLNDPMEGNHRLSKRSVADPKLLDVKKGVSSLLWSTGIGSLSEVYDHEPMWAHYADQFKGICIRYLMSGLLNGLGENIAMTRMMYSEKEPVLLKNKQSYVEKARLCLSCKGVRWSSEREWRIFSDKAGPVDFGSMKVVSKIYIGERVDSQDRGQVVRLCREMGIQVALMRIDKYSMQFSNV